MRLQLPGAMAFAFLMTALCAGPAAAAEKPVAVCLAAETYPDGRKAYFLCTEAVKSGGLDARTKAQINFQLGDAFLLCPPARSGDPLSRRHHQG